MTTFGSPWHKRCPSRTHFTSKWPPSGHKERYMNTEINSKIKGPIGPLILVAFWAPLNPFWTCRLTNFDEFWVTKFGRYFAETAVLKNMSFCQISADFFGFLGPVRGTKGPHVGPTLRPNGQMTWRRCWRFCCQLYIRVGVRRWRVCVGWC